MTHFVPSGAIVERLSICSGRATASARTARSRDARFELEDPDVRMHFDEHSWAWDDNPFLGTPQLNGLKIVNMLLSNWDTKDRRDVSRGSNTAIFEYRVSRWGREARYLITDWGGAMGRWGSNVVSRGRWDVGGVRSADAGLRDRCHGRLREFRLSGAAHRARSPAGSRWRTRPGSTATPGASPNRRCAGG